GGQDFEPSLPPAVQKDPARDRGLHCETFDRRRYRRRRRRCTSGPAEGTTLIEPSCSRVASLTSLTDSSPYSRMAASRSSMARSSRSIAAPIHLPFFATTVGA